MKFCTAQGAKLEMMEKRMSCTVNLRNKLSTTGKA